MDEKNVRITAPRSTRSATRGDSAGNHHASTSSFPYLIRAGGEEVESPSNSQASTATSDSNVGKFDNIVLVAQEVVLSTRGRPIRTPRRLMDEGLNKKKESSSGFGDARGATKRSELNSEQCTKSKDPLSQDVVIKCEPSDPEEYDLHEEIAEFEPTESSVAYMYSESDEEQGGNNGVEQRTRGRPKGRRSHHKKSKIKVSKRKRQRSMERTSSISGTSCRNESKERSQQSSPKDWDTSQGRDRRYAASSVISKKENGDVDESALVTTSRKRSPSKTIVKGGRGRPKKFQSRGKANIDSAESSDFESKKGTNTAKPKGNIPSRKKEQKVKKVKESKSRPSHSKGWIVTKDIQMEPIHRQGAHQESTKGSAKGLNYSLSSQHQLPNVKDDNRLQSSMLYVNMCKSLRNLLKLPKAHKWVVFEFFYSDIDREIFLGENDFEFCVRETVPNLKTRNLTRTEWNWVRNRMGKPRRFSDAFLQQERTEIHERREKIRIIQQKKFKPGTLSFTAKDVPKTIPLLLPIGTRITARIRKPQDGLFQGIVNGIDKSNNTYRITLDRPGLGSFSVPDYEILANGPVETVPAWSYFCTPVDNLTYRRASQNSVLNQLSIPIPANTSLGNGYPIRLLLVIIQISKQLRLKKEKLHELKEFNAEAEKLRAYGKSFNNGDVLEYAEIVVKLQNINKNLAELFDTVQVGFRETFTAATWSLMIDPDEVKEQAKIHAAEIVEKCNYDNHTGLVKARGKHIVDLITNLTTLMTQQMRLTETSEGRGLHQSEVKGLTETVKETKGLLIKGKNVKLFQNKIEIPMKRIELGLCIPTCVRNPDNAEESPNYDFYT